ncbi:hypothetical protein COT60_03590 [Candidatus Pacearchaeota archaeon CG09_land_8_20_14_0_10_30_9]|nr:hypothetical protein [Candidatus Pacearchaeota archaeon]PIN71073.1 MAG: hypothetical protein COV77_03980 [Candidatus Pacearchaeota archaeon CG11_big_fil_rev_8_21_14_0_20_30_13]PIO00842.1 MAG: hypothetical protein COT60_03590 [Candidatus Pacearchaeota archaeon CG09_land_8_20_14_0_10_30_9]PIZ82143.1 MAG: hypothetical protein COX98_00995 [Candidatus Pacearchaeota archaeon CG_4_10_14_0_2_um_filter_30_11]PJA71144.1 MAG: hypothetical protein CO153_03145 [Candidatus Pacearchaeota archaeon CG_4_9_14
MIPLILMLLDLIGLTALTLVQFNIGVAFQLVLMSSIYLIGKGFIFRDVMSIIDLLCGVYLLIAFLLGISSFIYWIILAWFLYKLFFVALFSAIKF